MKHSLVGFTGFVGGNLAASHPFDNLYNSSSIKSAFGADNGLVVYSGLPSEKFFANADPAADLAQTEQAMENIRQMKPEKLVLVSTVDVYPRPYMVDENTPAGGEGVSPYGKNRYLLETWVREEFPGALVLRLPGVYGQGLKKNFIYDMFTLVPPALTAERYQALCAQSALIKQHYQPDGAGFYRLQDTKPEQTGELKGFFSGNTLNALYFTDSRAVFQFYDLSNLWRDIQRSLKAELRLVNLATEPVGAAALYTMLFGQEFENLLSANPPHYDVRTCYGRELGGQDHYVADRTEVVGGIARFALQHMQWPGS